MLLVKTCCGCVSLQKGTITIGVLSLVGAILNTVMMSIHVNSIPHPTQEDVVRPNLIFIEVFFVTILIYVLIGGIFSALMVAGAFKRLSGWIFPWLAVTFGGTVAGICFTIAISIISAIELPLGAFFIFTIVTAASSALQIYCWQVVYSHYKELVAEKFGHQTNPMEGKVIGSAPYRNV